MFPKLKKRLSSFLVSEEGRISKQTVISVGAFISSSVIGGILMSKDASAGACACACSSSPCGSPCTSPCSATPTHTNDLSTPTISGTTASATHAHHNSYPTPCTSPCGPCGW